MAEGVRLSRDEWKKAVKRYLETSDFKILNVDIQPLGAGAGFLGDHNLAEITVQSSSRGAEPFTLHFFVKGYPLLRGQQIVLEQSGSFKREVNALREIFVQLKSALNNSGKDMPWTCECYFARKDIIVLENLKAQGYETVGARDPFTYEHAERTLKALANMHAASLIYEELQQKQPFRLDSVYDLEEGFFKFDPELPEHAGFLYVKSSIEGAQWLIAQMRSKKKSQEIEDKIDRAITSVFDLERASERYRNVICHGDLWRNNIFFREENGKPISAKLVDFQIIRFAPPANDIMSFLYLSTDRSFRKEFLSPLITAYYDHLSHNLKQHGLSAENILPWAQLKESCEYYRKLGIAVAAIERPFTLMNDLSEFFESSEIFDQFMTGDRSKQVSVAFEKDSEYREKISEVIEELIEFVENE